MSRQLSITTSVILIASASALAYTPQALADRATRYEVTVTNITRTQIISPVVIASHSSWMTPLFELGSPASQELAMVAEDAILAPLVDALSADSEVHEVHTFPVDADGPIPIMPGESASQEIEAPHRFRNLSMVAMLVSTNDAFFGLAGVRAPWYGLRDYFSPAYDAGSEDNNEDCASIPGPPCTGAGVRDTDGAEGFVHVHAGVHGVHDGPGEGLVPSAHDWRNPVAKITIRRIPNRHDH